MSDTIEDLIERGIVVATNNGEDTQDLTENLECNLEYSFDKLDSESCKDIEDMIANGESGVANAPELSEKEFTTSSLIGFYRKAIKGFLALEENYSTIEVLPARNVDQEIDYHQPIIFVGRGSVRGEVLGTPDSSSGLPSLDILNPDNVSAADSKVKSHSVIFPMNINIVVQTLAEGERVGFLIYKFLLALSGNNISPYLKEVTNVTAPSMTSVIPVSKFKSLLELDIDFEVHTHLKTVMLTKADYIKNILLVAKDDISKDEACIG